MKTASEIILPFDQNTGKKLFLSSHDLSPPQADLFSAAAPEVEGHSQSDCTLQMALVACTQPGPPAPVPRPLPGTERCGGYWVKSGRPQPENPSSRAEKK